MRMRSPPAATDSRPSSSAGCPACTSTPRQAPRLPNTSNFRLDGVDAQGAIILLDTQGICVSSGSACATGSIKPSHVLTAMGLASRPARETLRVSLARTTTDEEIAAALAAIENAVSKLRLTRAQMEAERSFDAYSKPCRFHASDPQLKSSL